MSIVDEVLEFARSHKYLHGLLSDANRHYINQFSSAIPPRPRAYSLWSPVPTADPVDTTVPNYITTYTSWPGLVDKSYSGRHLPPTDPVRYTSTLPPDDPPKNGTWGDISALFQRGSYMKPSRSSLLFPFFAQWFTDSILRINNKDRRRNSSNHDIDLCQIYGLTEARCRALRTKTDGLLKHQKIKDEEFPAYLYDDNLNLADDEFKIIPATEAEEALDAGGYVGAERLERKKKFYATGLERGNQSIGYVAISIIFLREHNRLARELKVRNPRWDDERLFQTARCINIVLLMKLVIEDYINHILGHRLFALDHAFAEEQDWYRANWMALEFDMLYRWHGLAPDSITVEGKGKLHPKEFRYANALLEELGVSAVIDTASKQSAGAGQIGNTPDYLWGAEYQAIKMGRDFLVQPYNEYRRYFRLKPYESFEDFPCDPAVRRKLQEKYVHIDRLEFFVGIFAEQPDDGLLWGDLLNHMVAYDAFTQIFSNPLLSQNVWGPDTFTQWGLDEIERTTSIQDLVDRNVRGVSPRATLAGPEVK